VSVPGYRVEVVRGRLTDERAEDVVAFWARHGALEGEAARARLPEVVSVLLDETGEIAGVNSAFDAPVALVGNRRFYVYRRFVAHGVPDEVEPLLVNAAYEVLDAEHVPGEGPVGLCVLVDDPVVQRRDRDAVWPDTALVYAGYQPDGIQVRIRYFTGAVIA
jgi:hypothetical protein